MSGVDRAQPVGIQRALRRAAPGALACALWMLASPIQAGTEAGVEAFKNGDYQAALQELRPAAEAGDPEAQYYLGGMYWQGYQVDKDLNKARAWFRRSLANGYIEAARELGYLYAHGIGVDVNAEKAVKLYRQAAEAGDPVAQRNLGLMYQEGEGVEENNAKAADWFGRAADQGDVVAQRELGEAYISGRGVDKDPTEGVRWLQEAAVGGDDSAQVMLAEIHRHDDIFPERVERAEYWMRKGMDSDNPDHQTRLALILDEEGIRKRTEAYRLFRRAAIEGHRFAQLWLAVYLSQGWGIERHSELSNAWLMVVSRSDSENARFQAKALLEKILPHKSDDERRRLEELAQKIEKNPGEYAPEQ